IPMFVDSFVLNEQSSNTGGLVRWPAKLLIPVGFALLALAGVSHLIKCVGYLKGLCDDPMRVQKEDAGIDDLVEAIQANAPGRSGIEIGDGNKPSSGRRA